MTISPHFTLDELDHSQMAVRHNIDNTPDDEQIQHLQALCLSILEPLRLLLGKPIFISSGFRSHTLNDTINGAADSQHLLGEAADIGVEGFTPQQLFDYIRTSALPYDQLIQEFNRWVHVSFSEQHRRQALLAIKDAAGKTVYTDVP